VRRVHLVRPGPPQPVGADDERRTRELLARLGGDRLDRSARWYAATDPAARRTAAALTDAPVELVDLDARRARTAVRELLARHPDDDLVVVADVPVLAELVAELTGRRPDRDLGAVLDRPDVLSVEMRRTPVPAPPSLRAAVVATVLVVAAELVAWQAGVRMGVAAGAAGGLALVLAPFRRLRPWALCCATAALVGLLVAGAFVVAASPRIGG
jgi:hypothetical protein